MGAGAQQALTGNVLIDVGTADSFLINGQLLPEVSGGGSMVVVLK